MTICVRTHDKEKRTKKRKRTKIRDGRLIEVYRRVDMDKVRRKHTNREYRRNE